MSHARRLGWVVLGVLIGWLATGPFDVEARQASSPARLTVFSIRNPGANTAAYFLRDDKTGACWLVLRSRDDISASIAPAPPESCQP